VAKIKLLAFDTSTTACSAALLYDNHLITRFTIAPRQHTQLILPYLQELLAEAELTLAQLDAIAFGRGPGSFTGVRIAASIAQSIAFAIDLPVIPVSTLQVLAQGAYRELNVDKFYAVLDAQMNEVYWGVYGLDKDKIMRELAPESMGDPKHVPGTPDRYPHAQDIAIIAAADYHVGKIVSAELALPVYLRNKIVPSPGTPGEG